MLHDIPNFFIVVNDDQAGMLESLPHFQGRDIRYISCEGLKISFWEETNAGFSLYADYDFFFNRFRFRGDDHFHFFVFKEEFSGKFVDIETDVPFYVLLNCVERNPIRDPEHFWFIACKVHGIVDSTHSKCWTTEHGGFYFTMEDPYYEDEFINLSVFELLCLTSVKPVS